MTESDLVVLVRLSTEQMRSLEAVNSKGSLVEFIHDIVILYLSTQGQVRYTVNFPDQDTMRDFETRTLDTYFEIVEANNHG